MQQMMGTTIVAVKRGGKCAVAGDGQVTFGENIVFKNNDFLVMLGQVRLQ